MYSATDKRTWEQPHDTRQIPPGRRTTLTTLGKMRPGDACFDAFFQAWRGILCITPNENKNLVEVCFEDGGLALLPPQHIFYVNTTGTRGWSEKEQSELFAEESTTFDDAMNRFLLAIQTPDSGASYKKGRKYIGVYLANVLKCKIDPKTGNILNTRGRVLGSIYDKAVMWS
jgi:hypothetical protein